MCSGPAAGLENELTLAKRLRLSRPRAVRQGIRELVDKAISVRKRGVGAQVIQAPVNRQVALTSLYDDLRTAGKAPRTEVIEDPGSGGRPRRPWTACALAAGEQVLDLIRVRYADDEPLAVMRNTIPERIAPTRQALAANGLYASLREAGITTVLAHERIGATIADEEHAELLDEELGAALLTMEHQILRQRRLRRRVRLPRLPRLALLLRGHAGGLLRGPGAAPCLLTATQSTTFCSLSCSLVPWKWSVPELKKNRSSTRCALVEGTRHRLRSSEQRAGFRNCPRRYARSRICRMAVSSCWASISRRGTSQSQGFPTLHRWRRDSYAKAQQVVSPCPQIVTQTLTTDEEQVLVAHVVPLRTVDKPAVVDGRAYLRQSDGDYVMQEHELRMIEVAKLHVEEQVSYDLQAGHIAVGPRSWYRNSWSRTSPLCVSVTVGSAVALMMKYCTVRACSLRKETRTCGPLCSWPTPSGPLSRSYGDRSRAASRREGNAPEQESS